MAANLIQVTFSGTATNISDPTGLFGAPRTNFSATYVDTYIFDLDLGVRTGTVAYDQVTGGSAYGAVSPLVSSMLTIDGRTVHFDGGVSDGQMNKAHNYTESYVDGFNGLGLKTLNYQLIYFDAPYDLATLFTANGAGRGAFLICAAVADECTPDAPILSGSFSPENVSVTAIVGGGGAPEPATWALMIAGFGVTGLALRLRSARDRFAFG